jgi:hypothetical protein
VQQDGAQTPLFGPNPNGIVMFDASGHYAFEVARSNLPKFKSNNWTNGTTEENKAVVAGTLAHFGRYTVDEASHTLTFHVEGSSFPNREQTQQKLQLGLLSPDDLKWEMPDASGGATELLYWKKFKQEPFPKTAEAAAGAVNS